MNIPDNIKGLMQKLIDNDFEAYIIGGAVRDSIMGREPHDYDIFTDANGEQILEIFPHGKVMGNDERQKKILTVIVDSNPKPLKGTNGFSVYGAVEISQYRANGERTETGTNLYEHCATCDFTMNAMACDINGNITDYFDGKIDITNKIIKCVGDPNDRFREDPLRMLRAIRQSVQLGFAISYFIECQINNYHKELLPILSVERIRDELIKMQGYPDAWRLLRKVEVLDWLLPEFTNVYNLDGGQYHNEDVDKHSENTYRLSCEMTDDYRIHIATKLHDAGKGLTFSDKTGFRTFIGHEKASVDIAKSFLKVLKFSNTDIKYITTMIKLHMMGGVDKLSDKTIIKYVNELESAGISIEDMLIMTYCDNQGNEAKPRCKFNEFYQNNNWLRKVYQLKYQKIPFKITDLEVSGKDLMEIDVKGKNIGLVLNFIYNLVQEGKISNDRRYLMYCLQSFVYLAKVEAKKND